MTETEVIQPQPRAASASLALDGALERGSDGMHVADLQLVADGEDPAAGTVVGLGEGCFSQQGLDWIVDAEAGLGPGEDA